MEHLPVVFIPSHTPYMYRLWSSRKNALELCQHPVHGRQPDILVHFQQLLVDIVRREVPNRGVFQYLEDLQPRNGGFEAGFFEIGGRGHVTGSV